MSHRLGFQDPDLTTPEHDAMVFWTKKHLQKTYYDQAVLDVQKLYDNLIYKLNRQLTTLEGAMILTRENIKLPKDINESVCILINQRYKLINKQASDDSNHDSYQSQIDQFTREIDNLYYMQGVIQQKELADKKRQLLVKITEDKPAFDLTFKKSIKIELEKAIANEKTNFIVGYADICATPYKIVLEDFNENDKFRYYTTERNSFFVEVKPRIQSFGELLRQIRTYETITGKNSWYVACPDTRFKDDLEDEGVKFIQITEDYKDYL